MKLAMLACLAALCLTGPIAHAAPGEAPKSTAPVHPAAPTEAAKSQPSAAPGDAASPAQTAPRPASSGRAERRRRSYAACNRASHQRGLRGGKRRRFLIRCRLGYERTRGQAGQPAAGPLPQTGRKP
ncbi:MULTISPECIES: hypothetical protein [Methylobacterium]|uniref:Serine/threonine protein kinase n=1 Tax=Methylobacterium longum TaxID=767694 RepID=A0ABT8AVU2_9HYPH|nr:MULTISPECIES: hypothetical protein [Methylobacterium]MCJ2100571.1 hypothetical protein [Methylobacterium sp. E-046]MDN3573670.1 hypothetical protein [Methylobacterium longum]GJE11162.1 hypothetical protein FOHLNKBM_2203 [Methylobacterium longum]